MTTNSTETPRWLRPGLILNLAIFIVSVAAIIIVANYFARVDAMRVTVDATKTRSYSLSEQSETMLQTLAGDWTIALILSNDTTDPATRRQINEVLERYDRASEQLTVQRIDPSDPASLGDYEALIARLQVIYGDLIVEYDTRLDAATASFEDFMIFAQQYSAQLEQIIDRLPDDGDEAAKLRTRAPLLAQIANQGQLVLDEVAQARAITDARPLPDYEGARSMLATALWQWGNELADTATLFRAWSQRTDIDPAVRQYVSRAWENYEDQSDAMHRDADPLRRLPVLELSRIGRSLQDGEAALVISPDRATIIPANQLLPKVNVGADEDGGVTFDRRFRGEQLISAAIRSLQLPSMPMVVFMHVEDGTLFTRRDQQFDLVGAKSMLDSSRFVVREWRIGEEDAPTAEPGQPVVWVVVPPGPSRSFRGMSREEQGLIDETVKLVQRGEAVMLNMYPNLLHRIGQPNPWEALPTALGVTVDTSRAVYERVRAGEAEAQIQKWQWVNEYTADHPIARAVNGRQTCFGTTIGVAPTEASSAVRLTSLAQVLPSEEKWLERDLLGGSAKGRDVPADAVLTESLPIVVGVERRHPESTGDQRVLIVGSGTWLMSNVADAVVSVGGQRIALAHPGNYELMLASIAWLAQHDDLIAPSPVSQEVARIAGLGDRSRSVWAWTMLAGIPGLCLVMGAGMWMVRRI
ncbi:MAG: Gldg family protein [Planctomycetota bacterium]